MASAKSAALEDFSIEQLQEAIESKRRARIDDLRARRAELADQLRALDNEISSITGRAPAPGRRGGRRGARGPSMGALVLQTLAASESKEVEMGELVESLKGNTTSDKPSIIISQALIRLKKDGLVQSAGRGVYRLTAEGRKRSNEG